MGKLQITATAISLTILTGCATQFNDYEGTAWRTAVANICQSEGYITQEQFNYYSSFQMGSYAHQWIVDENKLQSMYYDAVNTLKRQDLKDSRTQEQLRLNCGQVATVAERVKPGGTAQQAQQGYQYTPPTTTNCMTTYGWTRCTSN